MSQSPLHTNRDLYLFVVGLREVPACQDRELEEYLRALWQLGSRHKGNDELALGLFAELLEAAFHGVAPPFDPSWRAIAQPDRRQPRGFSGWEDTIRWQIVDLRDMADAGMLRNERRYLGLAAPRGNDWYNFDPLTYLECATAGTCGGFLTDDDSGRIKLDPNSPDGPIFEISSISWDGFADFLWAGEHYE